MSKRGDVVIAGLGCRLAGIRGEVELWQHLQAPTMRATALPPERWNPELHQHDLDPAKLSGIGRGALINDFAVDFRALRIPPLQLERMHRMDVLAVGTMCEALLDAGISQSAAHDDARVIIAAQTMGPDPVTDTVRRIRRFELQEPLTHALADVPERAEIDELVAQLFNLAAPPMEMDSLLTSSSIIAGRLANIFNLRGGHFVVDCGAASSIAALEQGLDAIASGQASMVVVAAFSPMLTASSLLRHAAIDLLGDGAPFDPGSRGLFLGEGCVALVLRRAADVTRPAYALLDSVETAGCAAGRDAAQVMQSLGAAAARLSEGLGEHKVRFVASRAAGLAAMDGAEREALATTLLASDASLSSQAGMVGHLQAASGLVAVAEAALACRHGRWPRTGATIGDEEPILVSDAGLGSVAGVALLRRTARDASRARASIDDEIAIIAAGAITPRAASLTELWQNVLANVDAIGDLPSSRFDAEKLIGSGTEASSMMRTRLAGIAERPRLDPQRLGFDEGTLAKSDPAVAYALGVSIEALGQHDVSRYRADRVDVVFGQLPLRAHEALLETRVLFSHHLHLVSDALRELGIEDARAERILRVAREHFDRTASRFDDQSFDAFSSAPCATAVAKAFGFRGLLASVDAACASAMAALKVGMDRLLRGRADLVVAGGVAYNILPEFYIALSMLGFLSPDAAPPFSRSSNGFVPAEGAGCVLLKRKSDAVRDCDRILAIVRGLGCSSDGRGQAVLAPNGEGQQLAIRRALAAANVSASEIDLLEAHGAGTRTGDQVEMASYAATYGRAPRAMPLAVGALKSQIGHTSSASGILGLIKVALSLDNRMIAPSNLDDEAREDLPFGKMGFELATKARKWFTLPGKRRYGAVSAIGMGGANYHVILARHDAEPEVMEARPVEPPRGTYASRFVVDRVPLPRGASTPRSWKERHVLIVAGADAAVAAAVCAAFTQRGAAVSALASDVADVRAWIERAKSERGQIAGVVDVTTFVADAGARSDPRRFAERVRSDGTRFFSVARAVYDDLGEAKAFFYVVTALGADFGLLGGDDGDPMGASRQGFVRALKQELPGVDAKAIDFAIGTSAAEVVDAVLGELDDANDRVDVAYRGGHRHVPQLSRRCFSEADPILRSFGKGDVVLFTGGGRGVTFVCARALANRGVRVVLCGRTRLPRGDEPWLSLGDEAFAAFRQEELTRRRKDQPTLTPAAFQRDFSSIAAQRELHANLASARALGLDLHYVVCDVTQTDDVARMVRDLRVAHGPLTGVVHGAMVETSRSVPSKTDDIVHATFATKAVALFNLWEATRSEPLRTFLCFGSGAGRFGNRGQTDYAGANALMAHMLAALARRDARLLHNATLDWTAWEGTGAAVSDPALAELVKATGVSSIRPEEGEYWFISELMLGRSGEALIFDERLLHTWPFLGSRADGPGERRRYQNAFGELLVPGEFPLVDFVDPAANLVERTLDPRRDAFVAQHRLYNTPILPATFGVELMAEAAAVLNPGFSVHRVEEYAIHTPSKLHRNEPLPLQIVARIERETETLRVVLVESRSKLVVKGRTLQELRLHHTARVLLQREAPALAIREIVEPAGVARARSFFHMAKDPVGLGPIFCRAAWLRVDGNTVYGRVRAPRMRDLFAHTGSPRFQLDPIVMDSAFQIAANWDGLANQNVSIPFGVEAVEAGRMRALAEEARVMATAVKVEDPDVYYDLVVVGDRDEVLMTIRGLHLRRISKLEVEDARGAS